MTAVRVCAISDAECSRGCGTGTCKKEDIAADAAAPSEPVRTHTTQPGESLSGIALRQCGDEGQWRNILDCNPAFDDWLPNDYFPVGTVLKLPPKPEAAQPDERTAFEAWARREKGWSDSLIKGSNGEYVWERARAAWHGWKGARSASQATVKGDDRFAQIDTVFREVTNWVNAHQIPLDAQTELFKALSSVFDKVKPNLWEALFDRVALELNCLPSSFVTGNDHVFAAIAKLRASAAQAGAKLTDEQRADIQKVIDCLEPDDWCGDESIMAVLKRVLDGHPTDQRMSEAQREEEPSLTNPLTPYGMLVRALRIVANTTLYDMSQHMKCSPAMLSGVEFGRKPLTDEMVAATAMFFSSKGIHDTLRALNAASKGD